MLGETYGDFHPDYSPFVFAKATDLSSLSTVKQNLYVAANPGYPCVLENPIGSLMEFEIIQAVFLNEYQFRYFNFRTRNMLLKALDKENRLSSGSLMSDDKKMKDWKA